MPKAVWILILLAFSTALRSWASGPCSLFLESAGPAQVLSLPSPAEYGVLRGWVQNAYFRMEGLGREFDSAIDQIRYVSKLNREDLLKVRSALAERILVSFDQAPGIAAMAMTNGPHVAGMRRRLDDNRDSLRLIVDQTRDVFEQELKERYGNGTEARDRALRSRAGAPLTEQEFENFLLYFDVLILAHDLGKSQSHPWISDEHRLPLHEIGSALLLEELLFSMGVDHRITAALISDLVGHNEGSGDPAVIWSQFIHDQAKYGRYPLPRFFVGKLLALFDRGDQAALGAGKGVSKILRYRVTGDGWTALLLENSLLRNAQMTLRQMNGILAGLRDDLGIDLATSPLAKGFLAEPQRTISVYERIRWTGNGGTLDGRAFSDLSSLIEYLDTIP